MATPCIDLPVHWPTRDEMAAVLLPKESRGFELGVWRGDFSRVLMDVVKPKKLILVDRWRMYADYAEPAGTRREFEDAYELVQLRFKDEIEDGRVVLVREDTLAAAKKFSDECADWINLDANHEFRYALRDLRKWANKLVEGGYLMCHDLMPAEHYGVDRAIDRFLFERPDFVALGRTAETDFPTAVLQRRG